MQGIYYLLSIAEVFVVFVWYIRNERVPDGEATRGLLAIKDPGRAPEPRRKKPWQHKAPLEH